jgi:hypothetical protein
MMAGVVTRIQILGVEVVHIPGGCTSLCQPVDIGVNCQCMYLLLRYRILHYAIWYRLRIDGYCMVQALV